ncbi:MAG: DRTGG domain-containing protein [Dehalococcoidia bacterium]
MRKIYITSNYPKAGKTIFADVIATFFHSKGENTAYIKLSNDITTKSYRPTESEDLTPTFADIIEHIEEHKVEDGIVCDHGLEDFNSKLNALSETYESVIIESDNFLDIEKRLRSDKDIVEAIEASMVKIIWYEEASMGDGDITAIQNELKDFNGNLKTVILNGVPVSRTHYAKTEILSKLSKENIPPLQVVSQNRELNSRSFGEVIEYLNGDVVAFPENLNRPVNTVMLGALALDGGIYYYGKYSEKIVITRWDRPDLQMPALNTGCQGLILTGGNGPIPYVLNRINELQTPVAVVPNGTVAVATSLSQGFFAEKGSPNKEKTDHMLDILLSENDDLMDLLNLNE